MKKILLFLVTIALCVTETFAAFSDPASGLYFQLVEGSTTQVEVKYDSSYQGKTSVVVPASVTNDNNTYSVVAVGGGAFAGCKELESVTLPNTIQRIWKAAFMNCEGLMNINIPEGVTVLGNGAFKGCLRLGLMPLQLPNTLVRIDANTFENCLFLTALTIPASVQHIGVDAFKGSGIYDDSSKWDGGVLYIGNALICSAPSFYGDCTVKAGTKIVADAAFTGSSNLYSVYFPFAEPPYLGNAIVKSANFYVPCGAEAAYKAVNNGEYQNLVKVVPSSFKVQGQSEDATMGNVRVRKSTSCVNVDTLIAVPFPGYLFKEWTDGVTDNPRAVALTKDTTLTARFEKGALLITKPNSADRGTTTGDTTAHLNDVVTVSATAKEGFVFKYWNDGVADNPRNITLVQDTTELIAVFLAAHTVTFVDWDNTILAQDLVADGDAATAPADPLRYGYNFKGWDKDFLSVTQDLTVTALYTAWGEAIENVHANLDGSRIILRDGRFLILRGDKTYTVTGQEVK